jgi:hypothetical protein
LFVILEESASVFVSALAVVIALALASEIERGFQPRVKANREAVSALPKAGA